jgi:serine/threonine-protein kinase
MPILTAEERIGSTLGDKYRLDAVLAHGGMGVLFRAEHTWTGRQVAIKMLRARELLPGATEERQRVERFLQEARAAATLEHPHVVNILDMGLAQDGAPYIAMELLRGESLAERLQRDGGSTLPQALAWLLPIMGAVAVAHDRGIVHRDLKPANVFLAGSAHAHITPKLLDFGVAKLVNGTTMTEPGMTVGTPDYMAPEQASGTEGVGPPADVWAMGVMFYRVLTGRVPFAAETPTQVLLRILQERPEPLGRILPALPPGVCAVIDRALSRETSMRYADMRSFAHALTVAAHAAKVSLPGDPDPTGLPAYAAWCRQATSDTTSEGLPVVSVPVARKSAPSPWRWAVVALLLLALVVAAGVWRTQGPLPAPGVVPPVVLATSPLPALPAVPAVPLPVQPEANIAPPVVAVPRPARRKPAERVLDRARPDAPVLQAPRSGAASEAPATPTIKANW